MRKTPTNKWHQIVAELAPFLVPDSMTRETALDDAGHIFSSFSLSPETTELEYLNLINALVLAYKPKNCLETGTAAGLGTLAISTGLVFNDLGRLTTLDLHFCNGAKALTRVYGTDHTTSFIRQNSVEFLRGYTGEAFDFVFLDSANDCKHIELEILLTKGLATKAILIHDVSKTRCDTPPFPNEYKDKIAQLLFDYGFSGSINHNSRGLLFASR